MGVIVKYLRIISGILVIYQQKGKVKISKQINYFFFKKKVYLVAHSRYFLDPLLWNGIDSINSCNDYTS